MFSKSADVDILRLSQMTFFYFSEQKDLVWALGIQIETVGGCSRPNTLRVYPLVTQTPGRIVSKRLQREFVIGKSRSNEYIQPIYQRVLVQSDDHRPCSGHTQPQPGPQTSAGPD